MCIRNGDYCRNIILIDSIQTLYCWYHVLINFKLNPKYYTFVKGLNSKTLNLVIRGALQFSIKFFMMEKQPQ